VATLSESSDVRFGMDRLGSQGGLPKVEP
jgi:hypothetical protein